jgi:ABC-type multidrug transport system fused ATPase/permease subunit
MARRPTPSGISALDAIRPFRWKIALTYALTLVEDLLELSYPWATGVAINGLIEHDYKLALPIVIAWSLRSAIGLFRQMYDTRVYTRVYNTIVERTILRQRAAGIKATNVAARSAMSRDFVTFFEKDVPVLVGALIGIFGSVAILFCTTWSSVRWSPSCSCRP